MPVVHVFPFYGTGPASQWSGAFPNSIWALIYGQGCSPCRTGLMLLSSVAAVLMFQAPFSVIAVVNSVTTLVWSFCLIHRPVCLALTLLEFGATMTLCRVSILFVKSQYGELNITTSLDNVKSAATSVFRASHSLCLRSDTALSTEQDGELRKSSMSFNQSETAALGKHCERLEEPTQPGCSLSTPMQRLLSVTPTEAGLDTACCQRQGGNTAAVSLPGPSQQQAGGPAQTPFLIDLESIISRSRRPEDRTTNMVRRRSRPVQLRLLSLKLHDHHFSTTTAAQRAEWLEVVKQHAKQQSAGKEFCSINAVSMPGCVQLLLHYYCDNTEGFHASQLQNLLRALPHNGGVGSVDVFDQAGDACFRFKNGQLINSSIGCPEASVAWSLAESLRSDGKDTVSVKVCFGASGGSSAQWRLLLLRGDHVLVDEPIKKEDAVIRLTLPKMDQPAVLRALLIAGPYAFPSRPVLVLPKDRQSHPQGELLLDYLAACLEGLRIVHDVSVARAVLNAVLAAWPLRKVPVIIGPCGLVRWTRARQTRCVALGKSWISIKQLASTSCHHGYGVAAIASC